MRDILRYASPDRFILLCCFTFIFSQNKRKKKQRKLSRFTFELKLGKVNERLKWQESKDKLNY